VSLDRGGRGPPRLTPTSRKPISGRIYYRGAHTLWEEAPLKTAVTSELVAYGRQRPARYSRSSADMSLTAMYVPRIVPVTFDRPTRGL
jgi:DNA-binding PucR family transcriptional regulator